MRAERIQDICINVEEAVSEGDLVVGYCKIKATHTDAGFGMESTGKPAAFEGMLMFRMHDVKVVEAWNSFDFLKMFQQMRGGEFGGCAINIVCLALLVCSPLVPKITIEERSDV